MLNILLLFVMLCSAVQFSGTGDLAWDDKTPFDAMSGCAAYYSEWLMELNAVYWGYIEDVSEYDDWLEENGYLGAVAVYRSGDKGRTVHILWPNGVIDGPYLAIESVAEAHYELGLLRNRVIDVDFNTAMKYNMLAPMQVTIVYDNDELMSFLYDDDNQFSTGYKIDEYGDCIK